MINFGLVIVLLIFFVIFCGFLNVGLFVVKKVMLVVFDSIFLKLCWWEIVLFFGLFNIIIIWLFGCLFLVNFSNVFKFR